MALVFGWYGNGVPNGQLHHTTAGRGDDPLGQAINGGADVQVVDGEIRMTESGSGARNIRTVVPDSASWAVQFLYTHRAMASSTSFMQVMASSGQLMRVEVNSSNAVTLRNAANGSIGATPAAAVNAGSTYVVRAWSAGDGNVDLRMYPPAGGAAVVSLSGAIGNTNEARTFVWGSVTNATATGVRAWAELEVFDTGAEPSRPTNEASVVRVLSNAGGFTASSGTIPEVLSDGSSGTYMASPDTPSSAVVELQLARMSYSDVVTVEVDDDISAAGSIARKLELINGSTVLATEEYTLSSTSIDTHTISTPSAVAAGEVVVLRITDAPA